MPNNSDPQDKLDAECAREIGFKPSADLGIEEIAAAHERFINRNFNAGTLEKQETEVGGRGAGTCPCPIKGGEGTE
jgi:hypothetical protein